MDDRLKKKVKPIGKEEFTKVLKKVSKKIPKSSANPSEKNKKSKKN